MNETAKLEGSSFGVESAEKTGDPEGVAWLLCVAVVGTSLIYSFRFTSFLLVKDGVFFILLMFMAVLSLGSPSFTWKGYRAFLPLWTLIAIETTVHLGLSPSRVPSETVWVIVRFFLFLFAIVFAYDALASPRNVRRVLNAFILSAVAAAVFGILQYAGALPSVFPQWEGSAQRLYSVFGNQDLFGGYMAMGIPLVIHKTVTSHRFKPILFLAALLLFAALLLSGSRSAWLAALVGTALVFPYRKIEARRAFVVLGGMSVLTLILCLVAPEATIDRVLKTFGPSDVGGNARLWFWAGAFAMVRQAPLFGLGMGNFEYWSPQYLGEVLHRTGGEYFYHNELHTQHTHSEPLQVLAETGVVGLACCLWMVARLTRYRGVYSGPLAAFLVFSLFNPILHSTPHVLAALVLAVMALRKGDDEEALRLDAPSGSRYTRVGQTAIVFALALFGLWAVVVPSYWLRQAEEAHLAERDPLELYQRVVAHPWPNGLAHEEYAIALYNARRTAEARDNLREALRTLDTGRLYLMLAVIAEERGNWAEAVRWLDACLWRWPSNQAAWERRLVLTAPAHREQFREEAERWLGSPW